METTRSQGFVLVLLSSLLFSCLGLCIELTTWDLPSIAFVRALVAFAIIGLFNWNKGFDWTMRNLLGGVLYAASTTSIIFSLKLGNVAVTTALVSTSWLYAELFEVILGRRQLNRTIVTSGLVIFLALALIHSDEFSETTYGSVLYGLFAAATYGAWAVQQFDSRKTGDGRSLISPSALIVAYLLSAAIFSVGFDWKHAFDAEQHTNWLAVVGAGIVTGGGIWCLMRGISLGISVPRALQLSTLEMVLSPFWVWLILGKLPGVRTIAACLLIIVAAPTLALYMSKVRQVSTVPISQRSATVRNERSVA